MSTKAVQFVDSGTGYDGYGRAVTRRDVYDLCATDYDDAGVPGSGQTRSQLVICRLREGTHSDFPKKSGHVLVITWLGGLRQVKQSSLRPLTVADVETFYSRADLKTRQLAVAKCEEVGQ